MVCFNKIGNLEEPPVSIQLIKNQDSNFWGALDSAGHPGVDLKPIVLKTQKFQRNGQLEAL